MLTSTGTTDQYESELVITSNWTDRSRTIGIRNTSASASDANSRQKRIRRFQEVPGFGVIVLSPLAVGFGVNIQAANHVIHFSRTWNPAKEDQATDRAYRIGQQNPVQVYKLIAQDTIEEKIVELKQAKQSLADTVTGGADGAILSMNPEQLLQLLGEEA